MIKIDVKNSLFEYDGELTDVLNEFALLAAGLTDALIKCGMSEEGARKIIVRNAEIGAEAELEERKNEKTRRD